MLHPKPSPVVQRAENPFTTDSPRCQPAQTALPQPQCAVSTGACKGEKASELHDSFYCRPVSLTLPWKPLKLGKLMPYRACRLFSAQRWVSQSIGTSLKGVNGGEVGPAESNVRDAFRTVAVNFSLGGNSRKVIKVFRFRWAEPQADTKPIPGETTPGMSRAVIRACARLGWPPARIQAGLSWVETSARNNSGC